MIDFSTYSETELREYVENADNPKEERESALMVWEDGFGHKGLPRPVIAEEK